jgi:hypothetical protein
MRRKLIIVIVAAFVLLTAANIGVLYRDWREATEAGAALTDPYDPVADAALTDVMGDDPEIGSRSISGWLEGRIGWFLAREGGLAIVAGALILNSMKQARGSRP